MGKKIKKTLGSVFKPVGALASIATGGLLGSEKRSEKRSDNSALLGSEKQSDNSALEAALEQQRLAAQNAQVDLSVENIPTIDTGGTAEAQAEAGTKARRRRTRGLSSSLGINVG